MNDQAFPYTIQWCPNPNVVVIHHREAMGRASFHDGIDSIWPEDTTIDMQGLRSIPGVTDGSVDAYHLQVGKAEMYSWQEVLPPVLEWLGNVLGGKMVQK